MSHIGVAVKDLDSAVELFKKLFGVGPHHTEVVEDQKVSTAFFDFNGTAVELLAPTSPDSTVAKFIAKRGEGVHHLSFIVDDIEKQLSRLQKLGFQLVDEKPRPGAGGYNVAFLHPKSTNGVLIEIAQKRLPGRKRSSRARRQAGGKRR